MSQLFQHNARRLRLSNLALGAAASYPGILGISGAYTLPALLFFKILGANYKIFKVQKPK